MKYLRFLSLLSSLILLSACTATDKRVERATLGQSSTMAQLLELMNQPGPIRLKKHTAANWQVPLSGLLNLNHTRAIAAGLEDRDEAIQLFVYTLEHPSEGTYLVDSGISESFVDAANNSDVSFVVKKAMNTAALDVVLTTKELAKITGGVDGVFLTHIHLDHIMGLTDLNGDIPVYVGPGEASSRAFNHVATRGTTTRLLRNVSALQVWDFADSDIVDVFGDASLWAIHVPGHSPGATAYLARTADGPHLMIGDATHTRWGWDNQVEPGTYSKDIPLSVDSLRKLKDLASHSQKIVVHPGHQN